MNIAAPTTPEFGRTDGGQLGARVEDRAWLAMPYTAGLQLLSAWRLTRPMEEWVPAHFSGSDGLVQDEAAFRAHVEEFARHRSELRLLARQPTAAGVETPWGASQGGTRYDEGVTFHTTASHGGFQLSPERNVAVDARLRNPGGWYEEDAEWAKVAFTFPALFTTWERHRAGRTLRNDQPDAWEAILGVVLLPGQSHVKDRRLFEQAHADRWVVVSASRSDERHGMTLCTATRGGLRQAVAAQEFLVPADEYDPGRFGFVIDEARHARFDSAAAEGG